MNGTFHFRKGNAEIRGMIGRSKDQASRIHRSRPCRDQEKPPGGVADQISRLEHKGLIKKDLQMVEANHLRLALVKHFIETILRSGGPERGGLIQNTGGQSLTDTQQRTAKPPGNGADAIGPPARRCPGDPDQPVMGLIDLGDDSAYESPFGVKVRTFRLCPGRGDVLHFLNFRFVRIRLRFAVVPSLAKPEFRYVSEIHLQQDRPRLL